MYKYILRKIFSKKKNIKFQKQCKKNNQKAYIINIIGNTIKPLNSIHYILYKRAIKQKKATRNTYKKFWNKKKKFIINKISQHTI